MTKNKNTNPNKDRISIVEARHAIGMTHRNYSDEQIETIIDIMLDAAEYAFEQYDEGGKGD